MAKSLTESGYSEDVTSMRDLVGHTLHLKTVAFGVSRTNGQYAEFMVDRVDSATGEVLEADARIIGFGVQVLRVARHLARTFADLNGALKEPVVVHVESEGDVVLLR